MNIAPTYHATTYRDRYGVPHIFADTESDALEAFGYAQAFDRLPTMLAHYLAARGAAASVLGAGSLERDIAVRAYRLPEIAMERYGDLPEIVREGVEAFAAGVNRYMSENPAECPAWAFPVVPVDVAALALLFNLLFATDPAEKHPAKRGSNGFAVAGSRTDSGNAIVSLDPHLPLDGALRWYEGRVSGGELDFYGVAFVGVPYMAMGTNGKIAWGNTVNAPDLSDWYEVRVSEKDGKPV
ncbi:MAG: penicillin acylase family protein, partial [Armatimonadetes bacterium]|nr:penicillin acylase family protein [Armatimonadota bacterium]